MPEIDQATRERYELVKSTHICPDCGSDVKQTTLEHLLGRLGEKLGPEDVAESIVFECTQTACGYAISIGELPNAG